LYMVLYSASWEKGKTCMGLSPPGEHPGRIKTGFFPVFLKGEPKF
jgi:hypothetical protein